MAALGRWLDRWLDRAAATPVWFRLALIAGLCFFVRLGGAPLFDVDEGAFSAATMEMLARGDYVMTWLGGQPRFDKPILIYWLQAASVSLLGLNEWALRLPSALAGTGWMLLTWRFARRFGDDTGVYAALLLAAALAPMLIARSATADALLDLCIAGALFDAWRHIESGRRLPLLRMYAWIGVGLLAKGPIAAMVPLLPAALWCLLERDWRRLLRAAFDPLGWLLLLAIAAPWYIAIYLDQGQAFIDGFILKHNVGRFGSTMLGHGGSPFYYFVVLPLILLPFTGLLFTTLSGLRRQWSDPVDRYLWLAFLSVFVFFSFSGTQLPHYVLYGAAPLAVLMARHRDRLGSALLAYLPVLLLAAALLLLPELLHLAARRADPAKYRELLTQADVVFDSGYRAAPLLLLAAGLAIWAGRVARARGLATLALVQVLVVAVVVVPVAGLWQQGRVLGAAAVARTRSETIVTWGANQPSFAVYRGIVTPVREPVAGEVVLTQSHRLADWPGAEVLFQSAGLTLAKLPAAAP
jgi:4-amino-4-deoxy-L-arabinose transferase-like glycosyltransferase